MEDIEIQDEAVAEAATVGATLRRAREAAGLSRSDIAMQTKIAERHLAAIEEDRLGDLAARTYAVGFSRAYARTVGLDEGVVAAQVRHQLDASNVIRTPSMPSFEPGDPARVPPLRLAWIAAGGAVVVIGLVVFFWSSFFSPEGTLPSLLPEDQPKVAAPAPAPRTTPAPAALAANAPVVLTATSDRIWVKVTDAEGNQLFQKELVKGESWTVPADAKGAQLRTGRPDALAITVGGKPVAALPTEPATISGVSLAPADLVARARKLAAPSASAAAMAASAATMAAPASATRAPSSPVAGPTQQASAPRATAPQAVATPSSRPSATPRPSASAPVRTPAPATSAPSAAEAALPAPVSTVSE